MVVVGDGYTTNELAKFQADSTSSFFAVLGAFSAVDQPSVNGYRVFRASNESGCDDPSKGIVRDTAYSSGFDAYITRLLGPSYWGTLLALSDGATAATTNILVVMVVNTTTYGGSGGLVLCGSMNSSSAEVMRHELGHTFARLADEYCAAYPGYPQSEKANSSTNRLNPPWSGITKAWIAGSQYDCVVWGRAFPNCKMNSLGQPFCAVCAEAIHLTVKQWTGGPDVESRPARRDFRLRLSAEQPRKNTVPEPLPGTPAEKRGFFVTCRWLGDDRRYRSRSNRPVYDPVRDSALLHGQLQDPDHDTAGQRHVIAFHG